MKPRQRQAAILEHLQKQGKCSVEDLAHYFDTTGTTIRKDLVLLENSGAVIRTYGGVVLNKDEADPPIDHKTLINTHQKALIAEAAAIEARIQAQIQLDGLADPANALHVAAPMAGGVVSVAVKPGQKVKAGDALLALEAMKMETHLNAERDAEIEQVLVHAGDQIDAKDLLVVFKP